MRSVKDMAEEKEVKKESEPKKGKKSKSGKKGKLPILVVLIVVLAGGGFFGLKMAKGGKAAEPVLELGDDTHVVSLGEYMVNTSDGATFLKATVLVHLAKGTHLFSAEGGHGAEAGPETLAPYVDAVREVLSSQSLNDIKTAEGEIRLKNLIAERVNGLYHLRNPGHAEKTPKIKKSAEDPEWNSETGPVLVVYLTEFVWEA